MGIFDYLSERTVEQLRIDFAIIAANQTVHLEEFIESQINKLKRKMNDQLQKILEAQEQGGTIIIGALDGLSQLTQTIASEQQEVADALASAIADKVPVAELQPLLDKINASNTALTQVSSGIAASAQSVAAIVPSIVTPTEPPTVPDPVGTPVEDIPDPVVTPPTSPESPLEPTIPVETVPVTDEDVTIEPTPDEVGLPGVPQIDF